MRRRLLLGAFCTAGVAPLRAFAQPGGGPLRGTATRSVSLYLERERTLAAALDRRDRAAVEGLLADDFTARTPASPDALDREPWLRAALGGRARESRVRDLTVREEGDVAIVSFLLDGGATTQFVVDVWKPSTGKLLARHVSVGTSAPAAPRRPTGRE
jgi:hypothetical protein